MRIVPDLTAKTVVSCNAEHHGLGNRIRVLLGCQVLAEREKRDFAYVWPTGKKFEPRLTDLWNLDDREMSTPISKLLSLRYPYRNNTLEWLDDAARRRWLWQIKTAHALAIPGGELEWEAKLRQLTPTDRVSRQVRNIFEADLQGKRYVGVMIRAHQLSHGRTLQASPVQWYLDRMAAMLGDDPDLHFYVSCDVPEVQERVVNSFPHASGQRGKGAYNSIKGVQDALTDLYLLASSSHLLGPHYSSFVELAWYLCGRQISLETSEQTWPVPQTHGGSGMVDDPLRPASSRR